MSLSSSSSEEMLNLLAPAELQEPYPIPSMNSVGSTLVVVVLLLYCYFQLEKLHPISEQLEKDISQALSWPIRAVGFFLGLLPWTVWDISDAEDMLKQGAEDTGSPPG
jgi:hypothetical protein